MLHIQDSKNAYHLQKQRKVAYRFSICLTLYFKTRLLQLKSTNWLQDSSSNKIIYCEYKIFSNLMDFWEKIQIKQSVWSEKNVGGSDWCQGVAT